jgi:NAD dependent epimerase/dehydratase family enzyme
MMPYLNMVKFGLGGHQGSGRQQYSWVHIKDVCRMMEWLYEHPDQEGTFNCSSPNPVSNKEFMQTVRKATGRSFGLPATSWMLSIGGCLVGTEKELLLKSRWVVPTRALQAGFTFKYPTLQPAVKEIIDQLPERRYKFLV